MTQVQYSGKSFAAGVVLALLWIISPLSAREAFCGDGIKVPSPSPIPVVQEGYPTSYETPLFAISPANQFVVAVTNARLKLWNMRGELLRDLEKFKISGDPQPNSFKPVFAKDGKHFFITNPALTAVYELPSGRKVRELANTEISDDGRFFVRRTEKLLHFSDALTGKALASVAAHPYRSEPELLSFSPQGDSVASIQDSGNKSDGKVRVWNIRSGKLVHVLQDSRGSFGAEFGVAPPILWSPNGRVLVTAGEDPDYRIPSYEELGGWQGEAAYDHSLAVKVWDVQTGRLLKVWKGHGSFLNSSPLARFISDHQVSLYEHEHDEQALDIWSGKTTPHHQPLGTFSPDGTLRVIFHESLGTFDLQNALDGKLRARFPGRSLATFKYFAWSPDNKLLAATEGAATPVRVFDMRSGALLMSLKTNGEAITMMHWLQNGRLAAATPHRVYVWNRDGTLHLCWKMPTVSYPDLSDVTVSFSTDATLFVSRESKRDNRGATTANLRLWRADGTLVRDIPDFGGRDFLTATSLVWIDTSHVALQEGGSVAIWNLSTGMREQVLPSPDISAKMFPVAASPDSKYLLCSSSDSHHILLWNVHTGQLERTYLAEMWGAQWSGDSKAFVAGQIDSRQTNVFSLASDKPVRTVPLLWPQVSFSMGSFSPDLQFRVDQSEEGSSEVYGTTHPNLRRVSTGKIMLTWYVFRTPRKTLGGLADLGAPVTWLALTPDGFYNSGPDIDDWLRWRQGDQLLPRGALHHERYRPDKVRTALTAPFLDTAPPKSRVTLSQ